VTAARFPAVAPERGHYESFYLRAVDPERPRGAWIRYTTHQRPGRPPTGSLWSTVFDAEAGAPAAVKQTMPGPVAPPGAWIAIGDAVLGPDGARGSAQAQGRSAAWELAIAGTAEPLRHLPREWMYRAPLPRTKLESPRPDAVFSGWVEAAGRRLDVAGWRGMVGHNWGSEHAEQWVWLHGTAFDGAPDAWLDLSLGRVRAGPFTTPWVANGALSVAGDRYPLRRVQVIEEPNQCTFKLSGRRVEVRGTVLAPRERFVGWVYADPDGSEHHAVNCSIADMRLRVSRGGGAASELVVSAGAAYELGMRERDHGIQVQPHRDG